ncbi:MAG: ribosome biogenesis/translation initiation ATPase RLI [Candidatus Hadarchaeales archaeon]
MPRLAVLDRRACQPKLCSTECLRYCPGVRMGNETIVIDEGTGMPRISETLCRGCGICIHKCPFGAITIVNLPEALEGQCIHRYGENGFALYRLPIPKEGCVVGLIGKNGIGKTTIVQILAGLLKPNLGGAEEASEQQLAEFFRGSELQNYFASRKRIAYKPQGITDIPKVKAGSVDDVISNLRERVVEALGLGPLRGRKIEELSGGELQRLAIALVAEKDADIYFFDEPSSHLDINQRLKAAEVIRGLAESGKAVVVVEHDLALLDYMCDQVHVIYGKAGAYGVVSAPYGVRAGINIYLNGYLPSENVRFRKEEVRFEVRPPARAGEEGKVLFRYPRLKKKFDGFSLEVSGGEIREGEVIGIVGPNGIGKTTFIRMLAGEILPDEGRIDVPLSISYKPQYPEIHGDFTVREWLRSVAPEPDPFFEPEVLQPLGLLPLLDRKIDGLSGGELQRVAIAGCLGKKADIYLLDEPSAYLDVEERLLVASAIKMVVDHDVLKIDSISTRLIVFSGTPGVHGNAGAPLGMRDGMNIFLRELGITFRRDPQTGRPRANKPGSVMDREQREKGEYFYT